MTVPVRSLAGQQVHGWALTVNAGAIEYWRREVGALVAQLGASREAVELARLGVSELLSNVSKHVESRWCCLTVCQSRLAVVVVQVLDRSPVYPVVHTPAWDAESGRGLWLLREMADGFGCLRHVWDDGVVGKSVWFACRWGETEPVPAEAGAPVGATREVNYRIKSGELP
ncbi:ATP-binding protein [Streptomyces profundus]|uniref:ATP-binding protein n=1 Tax=Streptomyces profundus TaxID=2867410 RepID=UPI001D168689|nr:ATP-binding protein [Streptomyces sp. MA3_2.13]UED83270.1 ATP-binding protein [Streptomyces sp. MA3_2.13]